MLRATISVGGARAGDIIFCRWGRRAGGRSKNFEPMNYPTADKLEEIRTRWFHRHVATLTQHAEHLAELVWKQPDSGIYSVRYILSGGALMVHGDLGEAIYRWGGYSDRLDFAWVTKCNLDYFHGKCCASERGRDYVHFSREAFVKNLRKEITNGGIRAARDWDDYIEDICDEGEARQFLQERFKQCDSETLGSLMESGRVLELRCASHLIGIQMAVGQLAGAPVPAVEKAGL